MERRLDRRLFLASLGSAGMLAACGGGHGSALPKLSSGRSPLTGGATLTFDLTQTDLIGATNANVYAYIVGLVSAAHDTYYWIDSSGTPQIMKESDNVKGSAGATPGGISALAANYPTDWADYSIPLTVGTTTTIPLSNISTANMPELGVGTAAFSGRIFISVGLPKLPITPTGNTTVAGGVSGAAGWTAPVYTFPPGNLTLYDWIEFSFDSAGNFNGNPTQVNQFGFPLMLNGTPGGTLQGQYTVSRNTLINSVAALSMYNGSASPLVAAPASAASAYPQKNGAGIANLRVVSPQTLVEENCYLGPLASYFYGTIAQWYQTWKATPLVTSDLSNGYYTGFVPASGSLAGILVFYKGDLSLTTLQQNISNGVTPAAIISGKYGSPVTTNNMIVSADILACTATVNGGSVGTTSASVGQDITKMIAAAFNRGVMSTSLNDATCGTNPSFYPTAPGSPPWNQYAQQLHAYSANGLAYGFSYDDVCGQNPSIGLTGTQSVTITLGNFFS